MSGLLVRPYSSSDGDEVWAMLQPVFAAGDTYPVDTKISRVAALDYWCIGHDVFVFQSGKGSAARVDGTYFICPNQKGGGDHVCNCGFVTAPEARGQGVARAMLAHSLETARASGFRAMQFNFVVSTNERAIATWQRNGFKVVGRLPGAFRHPEKGYVDVLVMYCDLTEA
jgi:GNAT superfamily N-acetyltransferase